MTTTDHHRTDNQLTEDGKLPAEGGIHGRVPETEADVRAIFISLLPNEYGWSETYYADTTSKKIGKTAKACTHHVSLA